MGNCREAQHSVLLTRGHEFMQLEAVRIKIHISLLTIIPFRQHRRALANPRMGHLQSGLWGFARRYHVVFYARCKLMSFERGDRTCRKHRRVKKPTLPGLFPSRSFLCSHLALLFTCSRNISKP